MTLNVFNLTLAQIDTTLIDVRPYVDIMREAERTIESDATLARVVYVIGVAYENANDTIMDERAAPTTEWPQLFRATMASFSVDALREDSGTPAQRRANRLAKAWFARRGIRG